jgi:hypothetical protein
MTQALHLEWHSSEQAVTSFRQQMAPFVAQAMKAGQRLAVVVKPLEDEKSDRQRRFYHGVVLAEIAEHARADGQKYSLKTWKEYFRDKFVGYRWEPSVDPVTGKKINRRIRISSEELGVKAYAKLITQVQAFAITELGLQGFSVARWEDYR